MSLFALKTLFSDRGKALTALVGVVFSLVLVNIQGGLYLGLIHKASILIDNCDADIWVGHWQVENVDFAHDIPEVWLNRIRGIPGIQAAEAYIVGKGIVTLNTGGYEDVWIIGSDPKSMLGGGRNFTQGGLRDLRRPNSISIDELDAWKLGDPQLNEVLEINGRRAKVVAKTRGLLGFMTTPYLFTTLENARLYSGLRNGYCSYFLVTTASGADVNRICRQIRQVLPETNVHTSEEFREKSENYFLLRTGIGISFGAATLLGLLVGLVMVAQSLYALALDHLSEYATLKAIGAEDRHVYSVVVLQSLLIALIGSVIGVVLSLAIGNYATSPIAPIEIPPRLVVMGILLVFLICLLASLLPFYRIRRVDPATVLQG